VWVETRATLSLKHTWNQGNPKMKVACVKSKLFEAFKLTQNQKLGSFMSEPFETRDL